MEVRREWPTPTVAEGKGPTRGANAQGGMPLSQVVRGEWSTPKMSDGDRGDCPSERARRSPSLVSQARMDWPTPTVCGNDNRKGASPTPGDGLGTVVRADWATPTVNAAKNATAPPSQSDRNSEDVAVQAGASKTAPLSPMWVATLMGFPADWCDMMPMQGAAKGLTPTAGPWAVDSPKRRGSPRARRAA